LKHFGRLFVAALGFGLLAALLGLLPSGPVGAQSPNSNPTGAISGSAPVSVVSPLPLPVTGNITASGSVSISGSVAVTNPGNSTPVPLIVTDANNPALTPFQARLCVTGSGNPCQAPFNFPTSLTVPVGNRLVIEQFAGECFPGAGTLAIGLTVTTNSTTVSHLFGLSYPLGTSTTGYANHLTRLYADGGTTIIIANNALVPANLGCDVAISGHLFPQ
jgi:hypothetical protein